MKQNMLVCTWVSEWMCEDRHSSQGCLWPRTQLFLFPCPPRETREREAERCWGHPVRDCSEAKAADCPGEDQWNPETSCQKHQVECGLWVLQRKMGLVNDASGLYRGFPKKPSSKLLRGGCKPIHLPKEGHISHTENLSSILLGQVTKCQIQCAFSGKGFL